MMVRYSKRFTKQYQRLSPKLQLKTKARIRLWKNRPRDESLRLHRLSGKLKHLYSIDITGDIRAVYEVIDDEVYLYQMIGTHSQLYD